MYLHNVEAIVMPHLLCLYRILMMIGYGLPVLLVVVDPS
jgi:hypothetical protein